MNKLGVVATVLAGITAINAVPTFAQAPRRFFPRPGQPANVYRPNPNFAPSVPSSRTHVVVDARGNQFLSVERFVWVWDPRQGRLVLGRTQEYSAHGAIQPRPPVDSSTTKAQPTKPTRPPIRDQVSNPGRDGPDPESEQNAASTTSIRSHADDRSNPAPSLPTVASNPSRGPVVTEPQPLYAANLGIYYLQVPYDNGTFGARLTRAPVKGKPAAMLTIDTNDVVFLLNDQAVQKLGRPPQSLRPDDRGLHRPHGPTPFSRGRSRFLHEDPDSTSRPHARWRVEEIAFMSRTIYALLIAIDEYPHPRTASKHCA